MVHILFDHVFFTTEIQFPDNSTSSLNSMFQSFSSHGVASMVLLVFICVLVGLTIKKINAQLC